MIKVKIETHKPSDYLYRRFISGNDIYFIYAVDNDRLYYKCHRTRESNFVAFSFFLVVLSEKLWRLCDED